MDTTAKSTPEEPIQEYTPETPVTESSNEIVVTAAEETVAEVSAPIQDATDNTSSIEESHADDCPVSKDEPIKSDNATGDSALSEKSEETGKISVLITEKQNTVEPEQSQITPASEPAEPVFPPLHLPEPISDYRGCISAFGFSQQGESHLKKDMPCQDRSSVRFISDSVVISAVADGVGSCALSDYGAATAVVSSLDYLEEQLTPKLEDPSFKLDVLLMGKVLREMMQLAYEKVKAKAEEMEQLLYSLQSTLTVAVFDGTTLYFAHAGDDGIVAITHDGKCEMATTRHKGEEASSVYPLQSRNTWQYGKVDNVVGFVMATDGVLDAFVRNETEGNRVYYPFIEPAFSTPLTSKEETSSACNDWYAYMKTPQYRSSVTDDLSFVCVVNQDTTKNAQAPCFDMAEWNKKSKEYEDRRRAALYPPKSQQAKPTPTQSTNTANASPSARSPQRPSSGSAQSGAPQQSQSRQNPVANQGNSRNSHSAGQSSVPYSTVSRNTPTPPRSVANLSRNTPVQPNAPYSDDKAGIDDLFEAGKKALEGVGSILLVGSEIILDAGGDAIRAVRNKRKENAEARREAQRQNVTSSNPNLPKTGNNGNNGNTDGK